MRIAVIAVSVIGAAYCLYHALVVLAGLFKKPKAFGKYAPDKRIAAVIAARNEEKVVGQLVASLRAQRYPKDLLDVYVVPNNCTDQTERVARAAGALILPCEEEVHSKGDVLRMAFGKLLNGERQYDAFVVLDADNIVDGGFMRAVNDVLCDGYQIGQAFRDSKNPTASRAAGCTSVFFWFMNSFYNRSRAALGFSAALNGTGIMISAKLLREIGYETTTLTEDLEYTAQCALHGVKIAWMEKAVTYDEQPLTMRDAFTQRLRWSAGTRQCMNKYLIKLFRGAPKNKNCLDVGMLFAGVLMQVVSFVPVAASIVTVFHAAAATPSRAFALIGGSLALCALGYLACGAAFVLLVCLPMRKLEGARRPALLSMGWYLFTWMPANLLGYLGKTPKWKAIPHVCEVGIEECEEARRSDSACLPRARKETETL